MKMWIGLLVFRIYSRVAVRDAVGAHVPRVAVVVCSAHTNPALHVLLDVPHGVGHRFPVSGFDAWIASVLLPGHLPRQPDALGTGEGQVHADAVAFLDVRAKELSSGRIKIVSEALHHVAGAHGADVEVLEAVA